MEIFLTHVLHVKEGVNQLLQESWGKALKLSTAFFSFFFSYEIPKFCFILFFNAIFCLLCWISRGLRYVAVFSMCRKMFLLTAVYQTKPYFSYCSLHTIAGTTGIIPEIFIFSLKTFSILLLMPLNRLPEFSKVSKLRTDLPQAVIFFNKICEIATFPLIGYTYFEL